VESHDNDVIMTYLFTSFATTAVDFSSPYSNITNIGNKYVIEKLADSDVNI